MMKYLFSFVLFLTIRTAFAQKDSTIYYLKSSGKLAPTRDSADLYVVMLPPGENSDNKLAIVNGYYLNGRKMYTTASLTNSYPIKPQGQYINYYANGTKRAVRNFENGEQVGDAFEYYPNGNLYFHADIEKNASGQFWRRLLECRDSTGKVLAENGNGDWIIYNNNYTVIRARGRVANGLRDSTWTVTENNKETKIVYKDGKAGQRLNSAGEPILTAVEQYPEFPGGIQVFYEFLTHNMIYPELARHNHITGRVIVSFVVERDGSLSDIHVANGIGYGCDEEALRVIQLCPPWKPGIQNGKPVRVQFSVPINFTLN